MVDGKVGIFCMANRGEGEPTVNARPFMVWLRDD